ncbi:NUDIX hydrolase [Paenibacillus sacheonensis]|uniref:NUDIX domain-containing protein n=1 Tax=Paenibacillus sacheonensis TaxID=742054 RepID=A0A7X4YTU9_9BACL|nr:NUDIX domain-containing protein [Paenibacillus sacheonensis]MBM7568694.1 ADP-ribose pyrophosphatase YjhB (NUDIX family) [Paenibacillus sacheonensis]NBC72415.1 NUDIX domain-containing protein [Paenibacillus sacheonensis]
MTEPNNLPSNRSDHASHDESGHEPNGKPFDEAANYSASRYRTPDGAPADIVIFTITSRERGTAKKSLPLRQLEVLLIQRKAWPFQGQWALPGGFSKETETLMDSALRELREETGVADVHIEYYGAYSTPGRDPRGWMISHAFFALVHEHALANRRAADDAADVRLFPIEEALEMNLAFDHREILADALHQIRVKMLTTTIAKSFLPEEFTIGELYQVIEAVVPEFEERNFIRKITSTRSREGIIEEVLDSKGEPKQSNRHSQRAAQLYRFTEYVPRLSIYS